MKNNTELTLIEALCIVRYGYDNRDEKATQLYKKALEKVNEEAQKIYAQYAELKLTPIELLIKMENTKLDSQIQFMEQLNSVMTTPITIAILNSLKELKSIKKNKL